MQDHRAYAFDGPAIAETDDLDEPPGSVPEGRQERQPQEQSPTEPVFGTLRFTDGESSVPFLRCASTDNFDHVAEKVRSILARSLGGSYQEPNLILSVTGGADLPEDTLQALRKGLTRVAENAKTWLVTGGSNSDVMKLVGVSENLSSRRAPLIGISNWGVLDLPKEATSPHLKDRLDINYTPSSSSGLDANHNFFLLVDSGCARFGGEISFRATLGTKLAEPGTPIVLIVIQGGPNTIQTAHDAVGKGTPLVLIAGSGQAADLLVYAWEFCHGTSQKSRMHSKEDLEQRIQDIFPEEDTKKTRDLITKSVEDKNKCVIFNVNDPEAALDRAILQAIIGSKQSDPTKILRQAIIWDQLDVARHFLETLKRTKRPDIDAIENDSLMFALMSNSPDFVDLFLKSGADAWMLRPRVELPAVPLQSEHVARSRQPANSNDQPSWTVFIKAVDQLYLNAAKDDTGHVGNLILKHRRLNFLKKLGQGFNYGLGFDYEQAANVRNVEEILTRLVSRDFRLNRDMTEKEFKALTPIERNALAFNVLMIWAVCLNKFRLAYSFWLRGNHSIPNALLVSCLLDRLARDDALASAHLADERMKMQKNSKKFEELAVGVLEECYHTDPKMTQRLLLQKLELFGRRDCIQIAYMADNLIFLSNPATQSVILNDWYYKLHTSTSTFWMLACILFPPWIFRLSFLERERQTMKPAGPSWESFLEDKTMDCSASSLEGKTKEPARPPPVVTEAAVVSQASSKLPWWRKIYAFYHAPMTRFQLDCICFAILVTYHSYMALESFSDTVQPYEIVLALWLFTFLADELRQFCELGPNMWGGDVWDWLDAGIVVTYFSGFITRAQSPASPASKVAAKCIFAVSNMLLFTRASRFYAGSTVLGPKVMMLRRMLMDLFVFFCLLVLVMLGYGIAIQAMLYPYRDFDQYTVLNVIYKPYFHIFGELFLDNMQEEADCVGSPFFTGCGLKPGWLVALFLAGYLLLSNLLLVNLLIAMFNRTYMEVQEQAMMVWNKQNYELLQEYRNRPFLPGPFVIFADIFLLVRWIFRSCQCLCRLCKAKKETPCKVEIEDRGLSIFQRKCRDQFERKIQDDKRSTIDAQVAKTTDHTEQTTLLVKRLQEDVTVLRSALELLTALDPKNFFHQSPDWMPPVKYPVEFPLKKDVPARLAIKPEQRKWDVPFPEYGTQVPDWTAESVKKSRRADPEDAAKIESQFNTRGVEINRKSFLGEYELEPETKRPVNPQGRTGMRGRGLLAKWGVNHAENTIVTRWRRDANGLIEERHDKRMLEFITVKRKDSDEWAIPGGFVYDVDTTEDMTPKEIESMRANLKELFPGAEKLVAEIYSQDPRNTDNAWVETSTLMYHDDTGKWTKKIKVKAEKAHWEMLHEGLKIYESHRALLYAVVESKRAYW